jgi:hypothetical protein
MKPRRARLRMLDLVSRADMRISETALRAPVQDHRDAIKAFVFLISTKFSTKLASVASKLATSAIDGSIESERSFCKGASRRQFPTFNETRVAGSKAAKKKMRGSKKKFVGLEKKCREEPRHWLETSKTETNPADGNVIRSQDQTPSLVFKSSLTACGLALPPVCFMT